MTPGLVYSVALILFVGGLIIGVGSTGLRILSFHLNRIEQPTLIWRDVQVIGGLSLSFLIIAIHRAAGGPFADEAWYAFVSAAPGVYGALVYCYFELWVIGHRRDR